MRQQEAAIAAQEKQSTEFQARLAERDLAFQTELGTTTQRLEAAQDHMLRQIDEAREGQRHAERALAKAQRRHERSEEHTSELQSLMRISYAVFCLKKKKENTNQINKHTQ